MAIPHELKELHDIHWKDFNNAFDKSENEGCGKYTEHWVKYAQDNGWPKVGHLRKSGGQTQYNGHANDAFLYRQAASETNPLYQAVDIIARAEQKPPYGPGNEAPGINWGIDDPRYTEKDWLSSPNLGGENGENDNLVPWVSYNEQGFEKLKKTLKHDYERRPQGPDYDVSVWAARVFHSTYMGPEGKPLGMDAALRKHKPEWCAALGIKVDSYYGD